MISDKFTVFFDDNTAYPIKIHKIGCRWKKKYEEEHKPTIHTQWYDVQDLQSAEKKAEQISKKNNNRKIVYARCGGNCFPRNHPQK